jgi:hypothetical protein
MVYRMRLHENKVQVKGSFGQVRDVLIIKATWLGRFEPFTTQKIATYIFDIQFGPNSKAPI